MVVVVETTHSSTSRRCCGGSTHSNNIIGYHNSNINASRKYSRIMSYCSRHSSGSSGICCSCRREHPSGEQDFPVHSFVVYAM